MHQSISRRKMLFLAAGAAGAGLFDVARVLARGTPGPQREYGWFPMGIQSYSLRGFKVDDALTKVQELGLHHVEFFSGHFAIDSDPVHVGAMLKNCRAREIRMSAHGVNGFTADHAKNRAIFEFANLAGIRNLAADPRPDAFDSLDKLVAEFGIRILIHNHGPDARYDKISDVTRAIKGRHPRVGACADLGHFIRSGEDPVKAIRELGDRLFGVHLKDFAEQKKRTRGVILGKGHLDLVATFKALRQVHFPADGALSLEYEENPEDPIGEIKECFAAAGEAARKTIGS